MTTIPKLVAKFWKTLDNPSAPSGKVDMFHLDDEGGNTVFSLGVSFLDGHNLERAKASADEFIRRCNHYPLMDAMVARMSHALRCTASQGTFDEQAIRKAVGFELAEFLMAARADIVEERIKCAAAHCANRAEYSCRANKHGIDLVQLCRRHTESYFPGVPLSMHDPLGMMRR